MFIFSITIMMFNEFSFNIRKKKKKKKKKLKKKKKKKQKKKQLKRKEIIQFYKNFKLTYDNTRNI